MSVPLPTSELLICSPLKLGIIPVRIRLLLGLRREVDSEEGPIERSKPADVQRGLIECSDAAGEKLWKHRLAVHLFASPQVEINPHRLLPAILVLLPPSDFVLVNLPSLPSELLVISFLHIFSSVRSMMTSSTHT